MEHPYTQGGGEAATQAGAHPNKATEEHQSQRHQGQEKLAPPQVWKKKDRTFIKRKLFKPAYKNMTDVQIR